MSTEVWLMKNAARELASDGIMFDPTDAHILIAAAELAAVSTDLSKLTHNEQYTIISAYDQVARVMI
jgi:hypothetical protein